MDRILDRSRRSIIVACALLLVLAGAGAGAGRAAADPATPTPTLATAGPIVVGTVVSWIDPAPAPGYALVGAGGGDEYTCPASYAGGTLDDDPNTIAVCNHRGFGGEYTVLARDAGMNLFYVREAAPTPFQAGGCCVHYWSAPVFIPVPSAADPVVVPPVVATPDPVAPVLPAPAPVVVPAPAPTPTPTPVPAPAAPVAAHAVTIGPATLTPSSLTPSAAQDPAAVLTCSARCTATLSSTLQLGSRKTTLKAQKAKLAAGRHTRLTIHLSVAQHRAIRKALAAKQVARVVTTIRLAGQAKPAKLTFAYRP
ncbi:MAG: hypothetical protein JWQ18_2829 [Conexibacter sp.]|nr:hypothetical protein [Conexibacter sp.]